MYTKKVYKVLDMAKWTRYETLLFTGIISASVSLYYFFDLDWLKIPWTPLALIGTAVAFVIGFQNNSAYGRIWEARKIWGGIVNTSRTFGTFVQDMVNNEYATEKLSKEELHQEIKTLTYRHIAWMTALRHAMRVSKPWETVMQEKANREWNEMVSPPEWESNVEDDMAPYLSKQDLEYVMSKNNKQTAMLYLQSHHLRRLKEKGVIWEFSFLELEGIVQELYTLQGQSERIKNFPYPKQYGSIGYHFVHIFMWLLPMAIIPAFALMGLQITDTNPFIGRYFVWLNIPFTVIVIWVFNTMLRIGLAGENPFEGSPNDVPISNISRGITRDILQIIDEDATNIPEPFENINHIEM